MRINFKKIFSLVIFTFSLLAGDTYHVMARDREQKYKLVFREEFNLPDGSQPNPKLESCRYGNDVGRCSIYQG